MRFCRGMTTVEVMVMMVATSLVIFASYGARVAAFQGYHEIVNRERALLYAAETLEQFEAMKRTRMQQDYIGSWQNFLGRPEDGSYKMVSSDNLSELNLVSISSDYRPTDEDRYMVRLYDNDGDVNTETDDGMDGFYTRLERRITLEDISSNTPDAKKVTVEVRWGEGGVQHVQLQAVYSDHVGKGFAL